MAGFSISLNADAERRVSGWLAGWLVTKPIGIQFQTSVKDHTGSQSQLGEFSRTTKSDITIHSLHLQSVS